MRGGREEGGRKGVMKENEGSREKERYGWRKQCGKKDKGEGIQEEKREVLGRKEEKGRKRRTSRKEHR